MSTTETTTQLMRRDDAAHLISVTPEAEQLKNEALAASALVGKVRDEVEQANAVDAQRALKSLISEVEKSRKDVKQPVLDFGRQIDAKAKEFSAELDEEYNRVSREVADYQQLEIQKAKAAQAAQVESLTKLEREREEAISRCHCAEEVETIQEEFNQRALAEASQIEKSQPARAGGQLVREEWEITVTNLHQLARVHPNCVKVTPLKGEIKQLLDMGVQVMGVKAEKVTKASVRLK